MPAPTLSLCDCPNGCVLLRFGYVTVHLDRTTFVRFADRVLQVLAVLETQPAPIAGEH